MKYSMGDVQVPETVAAALAVLCNDFGVGEDRIQRLKEAGFDPQRVQSCVNDLIDLFERYN